MISNKAAVGRAYQVDGDSYYQIIGVGTGQGARVDAVELAAFRAREFFMRECIKDNPIDKFHYIDNNMSKCVLATAAFYPKPDGPEIAYDFGIVNLIQPYGSKQDKNVIAYGEEHHMAMANAGLRHFKH